MVRRGSTVRVRQRASLKFLQIGFFRCLYGRRLDLKGTLREHLGDPLSMCEGFQAPPVSCSYAGAFLQPEGRAVVPAGARACPPATRGCTFLVREPTLAATSTRFRQGLSIKTCKMRRICCARIDSPTARVVAFPVGSNPVGVGSAVIGGERAAFAARALLRRERQRSGCQGRA